MRSKPLTRREWLAIEELSAFLRGLFRSKDESILRVQQLKQALIAAMHPGEPEPDQKAWDAADKKANRLLAAYTSVPVLTRDDEGYSFVEQTILLLPDMDLEWLEARAVRQVIYLANQGVLHQLIACGNCGTVFLPTRSGQKNCSASCSKKAYESGPEFRAKRNRWARDHYREHVIKGKPDFDHKRKKPISTSKTFSITSR
jgi:hypothetical protein